MAAHSTVRALYGAYLGNLYQVRRASDKTTKEVRALGPGLEANSASQDAFCAGTTCTISIIYDQSPNHNDVTKAPAGGWLTNGGLEADATAVRITLNGHTVHGVYTTSNFDNDAGAVGYRNNATKGVATGDQPEATYIVAAGKHYNQWCCFDYGNAEINDTDDGKATMEAVYFGSSTQWAKGNGSGPWVEADLEDGVYHRGDPNAVTATNTPLNASYVTAMLKGRRQTIRVEGRRRAERRVDDQVRRGPAGGLWPAEEAGRDHPGHRGRQQPHRRGHLLRGMHDGGRPLGRHRRRGPGEHRGGRLRPLTPATPTVRVFR